jgi:glyceraldehyde-3-phosphate dehydrogenase (NAD(P))
MGKKIVHVVGTGTIGEPLTGLLTDYREGLGIDEVTFQKYTPLREDRSKVNDLVSRGAKLAVLDDRKDRFTELGMHPELETEEAIQRASVVIDCTPGGFGHPHKAKYYEKFKAGTGFIAQGSEDGFGKKYARGINDSSLVKGEDQFIQIVSCNTHNVSCITNTLVLNGQDPGNLIEGRYVCIRRATDISQKTSIASPQVNEHNDEVYGSHHAKDAAALFRTLDLDLNLFSSAMKIPSQYMHILWFNLKVKEATTLNEIMDKLEANPLVALTSKDMTGTVFSFGRDHGHFGRILNETVVVEQTMNVKNNHEITGFCFTPQDGNSLLSSISATEWFLYPDEYEDKIQCLSHLIYQNI